MAEMISADDLAMFRNAHQRAVAAERGVQQLQQAQQQYQQAIGALQFVNATLMERYQLQQGGSFNPETGEIVRPDLRADGQGRLVGPEHAEAVIASSLKAGRRK